MAKFGIPITYLVIGMIVSHEAKLNAPVRYPACDALADSFGGTQIDEKVEISQNLALTKIIVSSIKAFKEEGVSAAKLKWDTMVRLGTIIEERLHDDVLMAIMYQIYDERSTLDILEYVKYAGPELSVKLWGDYMTNFLKLGYAENLNLVGLFYYLDHTLSNGIFQEYEDQETLKDIADGLTYYNTTKVLLNNKVCIKDFASGQYIVGFENGTFKDVKLSETKDLEWGAWTFELTNDPSAFWIQNVKDGKFMYASDFGDKEVRKSMDTFESIWDITVDPNTQRFALAPLRRKVDRNEKVIIKDGELKPVRSYKPEHFNWVVEKCEGENTVKAS